MRTKRKQLIIWLFEHSEKIYTKYFKSNTPWGFYKKDLLHYPKNSFGYHLGTFLDKNNFELIPKVERHDCYHVLTGYGTQVEDEIALQYLCFGNGKRSLYLFAVLILGTIILPDYMTYYIRSYIKGKRANSFYHFDFKKLLNISIVDLRRAIFLKSYITLINL
ncbi:Coq4 family protein [Spongiivirga citrea]|nr:Coq4 family protein [Spongiivirga citrea]